jgi:50S ribosomal protein L16 3-hydroxylase
MTITQISLGDLTAEQFLQEYWQKKPLLIRQAIPNFKPPITPDELAGLACEEGVESRLILEKHGKRPWEVKHGHFPESIFSKLPKTHWTLLVQEVNRHVPDIADLMDQFNFIPSWRLDDVMISYAVPQGSVGPHTDSYDVFLLQAYGQRRWHISHDISEFQPDLELKILQRFQAEQTWDLDPGDMLYLPPNIAHHGVALNECMTISIGFLAPSYRDLLQDYAQFIADQLFTDEQRYSDPDLTLPVHSGELNAQSIAKICQIIRQMPMEEDAIQHWFGCFISESRAGTEYETPDTPYNINTWWKSFAESGYLRRQARAFFTRDVEGYTLFIEGCAFSLEENEYFAASLLTGQRDFVYQEAVNIWPESLVKLLCDWTNRGWFYFYEL